jgi:hypothetical protein
MRGPRMRVRSAGGDDDNDCPGDDGSVNVETSVLCPSLAFETIWCLSPGFFRPTLCGDFAVNFSKETRDRVGADRYVNGCEQLANQRQRCALFAQLDDAIFQRHQTLRNASVAEA